MRLWKKCLILFVFLNTYVFLHLQWRLESISDGRLTKQTSSPIKGPSYRSSKRVWDDLAQDINISEYYKPLQETKVRMKSTQSYETQAFVQETLVKKQLSDYDLLENHNFTEIFPNLYIFSAFHDNRLPTAYVRMVVLFKKNSHFPLWCHFPRYYIKHNKSFSQEVPVRSFLKSDINKTASSRSVFYETCEGHSKKLSAYVVSCSVPDYLNTVWPGSTILLSKSNTSFSNVVNVSIVLSPHFPMMDHHLSNYKSGQTEESYEDAHKWKFTICVPPLFGNIQEQDLIEFIELSRLLGTKHIMFYLFARNARILSILNTYELNNFVSFLPWELPVQPTDIWNYGQSAAVWDCLMRNMHTSYWIVFNDLDEFIIPHAPGVHTWGDLVSLLQISPTSENTNIAAYSFKSAFYDPLDDQRHKPGMNDVISMRVIVRSAQFSKVRSKLMVNPLKVFEVGIHHLSKPLREEDGALLVNTSLAYIHHYRKCMKGYGMVCNKFVTDKTAWRYKDELRYRVNQSLAILATVNS